uniref:Uncharacterized protein n=1 Tax=mine drainage metagenome TaxID=410659 RepID=E6QC93_9ZZZZ
MKLHIFCGTIPLWGHLLEDEPPHRVIRIHSKSGLHCSIFFGPPFVAIKKVLLGLFSFCRHV